jgi:thymidylate synthase ThyX
MKKISAEIVADSIDPRGNRITSFLLTYPRFIHGEIMTHRMFSRNSASSRAIPFNKMVKMVEEDPFIPIAWQKDHKGMQGSKYITDFNELADITKQWLHASRQAILMANVLHSDNVTKQLCNRLLEPFMWHTVLVTATEYDNFFELRCPKYIVNWYTSQKNRTEIFHSRKEVINYVEENNLKNGWEDCRDWNDIQWLQINNSQAEIHIQVLAESMWDAMNESVPKELKPGEWHIPFGDNITAEDCFKSQPYSNKSDNGFDYYNEVAVKIATARAARISYTTLGDNPRIDYEADIKLHDRLLESKHMSPFEHCARVMTEEEYLGFHLTQGNNDPFDDNGKDIFGICRNFRGFVSYRYLVENNYD